MEYIKETYPELSGCINKIYKSKEGDREKAIKVVIALIADTQVGKTEASICLLVFLYEFGKHFYQHQNVAQVIKQVNHIHGFNQGLNRFQEKFKNFCSKLEFVPSPIKTIYIGDLKLNDTNTGLEEDKVFEKCCQSVC